jgi:hypothetical protein
VQSTEGGRGERGLCSGRGAILSGDFDVFLPTSVLQLSESCENRSSFVLHRHQTLQEVAFFFGLVLWKEVART